MTLDYLRRYMAYRQSLIDGVEYQEYLLTPEWLETRRRALVKAGHICERCGCKDGLEVHHLTYERKGHERPEDLNVLCETCHEKEHKLNGEQPRKLESHPRSQPNPNGTAGLILYHRGRQTSERN
jgi:5-methylcytosine-specific restriction endonuclease McrA